MTPAQEVVPEPVAAIPQAVRLPRRQGKVAINKFFADTAHPAAARRVADAAARLLAPHLNRHLGPQLAAGGL